jgi:hypothetical protein
MIRRRSRDLAVDVVIGDGPTVEVWGKYRCRAHALPAVRHLRAVGFNAYILPRLIGLRRLWDALDMAEL